MKKLFRPALTFCLLLAGGLLVCGSARADVVYNNSTGNLSVNFNPGSAEVGDEIILSGAARTVTNFTFQYWGNFTVDPSREARVRFYANDGTNAPAGPTIYVPNSLLFDSGWFHIDPTLPSGLNLTFDNGNTFGGNGLLVPDSFTWSVQFQGLGGGTAGVALYDPPTVGGNYNEYWDNAGGFDWQYRTITFDSTNVPANFGARIEAVPEPGVLLLGLLGGLGVLGLKHRSSRR